MNFSNVNINPAIIARRYPDVRINCIAKIQENQETQQIRVVHEFEYPEGGRDTEGAEDELTTEYIGAISDDGKITTLADEGNAKIFQTKYYSETESRTSVTLGTILADTWIARWEAEYGAKLH